MSLIGSAIVGVLVVLTLPVVVFPGPVARFRYRHAADPEPEPRGVANVRLAGLLLVAFELVVLASLL